MYINISQIFLLHKTWWYYNKMDSTKSLGVGCWCVKIAQCGYMEHDLRHVTFYVQKQISALSMFCNSTLVCNKPLGAPAYVKLVTFHGGLAEPLLKFGSWKLITFHDKTTCYIFDIFLRYIYIIYVSYYVAFLSEIEKNTSRQWLEFWYLGVYYLANFNCRIKKELSTKAALDPMELFFFPGCEIFIQCIASEGDLFWSPFH